MERAREHELAASGKGGALHFEIDELDTRERSALDATRQDEPAELAAFRGVSGF